MMSTPDLPESDLPESDLPDNGQQDEHVPAEVEEAQQTKAADYATIADKLSDQRGADRRPAFPIVGMGASAGGLEAFEKFFAHMPRDSGIAFILAQHLGPGRQEMFGELIDHFTAMQVQVIPADDGITIEPNRVYILPPQHDAALRNGKLILSDPEPVSGVRLPIDIFFRSLADELKERAIAIILSGTGSDGSKGLALIKEQGGMAMVQSPASASYDGMPQRAIETDMVDYILRPEEMPDQLIEYVKKEFLTGERPGDNKVQANSTALQRIFASLRRQTGHDFSLYKQNTLSRRITRRMIVNQIDQIDDYVRYIEDNPLEIDTLFRELLIGVTSFFRDHQAFAVLEQRIIPQLFLNRPSDTPIRIWVPGCSTGEEAYSIAMLLREQSDRRNEKCEVQIFATDIDIQAIEKARQGMYNRNIAADVSPERLQRFFFRDGDTYQISKRIRDMVIFAVQSIIKDPPFSRLDLISCRNLLIYLSPELKKKVIPLFYYGLKPDGFLFLGTAETPGELNHAFHVVDRKWSIYQRPLGSSAIFKQSGFLSSPVPMPSLVREPKSSSTITSLRTITERALIQRYAPACAVINEQGELYYTTGRTGFYLEPPVGEMSTNILHMAREGLRLPLTTALRKLLSHRQKVAYNNVQVKSNGDTHLINLVLEPMEEGGLVLVIFEEAPSLPPMHSIEQDGTVSHKREQQIQNLEEELKATREYLQATNEELETTNEELKSANEELQSSNEELQSTNEELETSKEELQSLHEEQVTVNNELRNKIEQINRANSDLKNLLDSIDVGTIFLDLNLCITRFTPVVTRIFSLREADIGRPISELVASIETEDFTERARHVLNTLESYTAEVRCRQGAWYWMRILPYRTIDNVIDGVIMTFTDITQQKQAQEQLPRLMRVAEKSASMIIVTDVQGTIEYVNPQVQTITGYPIDEIIGQTPHLFKANPSAVAQYEQAWQQVLDGYEWQGEFQHRTKQGNIYWGRASFSPVRDTSGAISHVVIAEEDISDRRYAQIRQQHMQRLLVALGSWHQLLATAPEQQELLNSMCRLLVDAGGYRATWIGLVEPDAPLRVRPVAQAGYTQDYLNRLGPIWRTAELAQSPLYTPLQTGTPAFFSDIHLFEKTPEPAYQALIVLPIPAQPPDHCLGVLVIHALEAQALQDEIEPLKTMADNLAYGLS